MGGYGDSIGGFIVGLLLLFVFGFGFAMIAQGVLALIDWIKK